MNTKKCIKCSREYRIEFDIDTDPKPMCTFHANKEIKRRRVERKLARKAARWPVKVEEPK
jgi:hypothetical protein